MTLHARLADHMRARTPQARIERQWAALQAAGLPGPATGRGRLRSTLVISSALLAGAIAATLWVTSSRQLAPLPAGAVAVGAVIESADTPIAVQLNDGSRVELSPRARLRLLKNAASEVALDLRAGKARFAVTHNRARAFKVQAGVAEVSVVGTRFELERSSEAGGVRLRVAVSEGIVEVRRQDDPDVRRLRAGESWSALVPTLVTPPKQAEQEAQPDVEAEAEAETAPEGEAEVAIDSEPTEDQPAADTRSAQNTRERGAAHVFERANLARRAGRMREAADAYAQLLARYPQDRRAGLSAFELGRIRMDALSDPAGAIEALERALRAGDSASFHEDALARMVVAYDAQGRREACSLARERYLARYPNGVHAHVLSLRCR